MHRILERQLRKLALDKDNPPQSAEDWQALLERIDTTYNQADEGLYTLKRSSEISSREMDELNNQLRQSKKSLAAQVNERTKNLQESEARNNTFLSMAPSAIIILDQDGIVVEFNASAEQMFGYQREEVLGNLASNLIVPEPFRAQHTAALKHFDTNRISVLTPKPIELPAMRSDGSEFPAELTLSAFLVDEKLFFTSAIQDVTERKISEQKLAVLASFPEKNDQPVLRIDRHAVPEYSNKPGLELLKAWNATIGTKLTGELAEIFYRVFTGNEYETHEHIVGDKTYMLRFVPVLDSGYVNVYGADHTVQKAYENELVTARDIAERSNESKSQFLAMMSHELRTPMNGVMGMSELLLGTSLNEKQRHYANTITQSADALVRIIDDILDISKIEEGKLELESESFKLPVLMQEISELFTEQLKVKQLQLTISMSPDIPEHTYGDSIRLRQIMVNLIGNAIKFTNTGEIRVSASVVKKNKDSVHLNFTVEDNGVGMDKETCERIFTPFTQADQSTTRIYGGTGLGLTIVKRLVEMLGGEVTVQSEPNKGSHFQFTVRMQIPEENRLPIEKSIVNDRELSNDLPLSNIHKQHFLNDDTHNDNLKTSSLNILLAEDNLINQEVALEMFELLGHQVDVVNNGIDALDAVKIKKYDLIFMDCRMPKMDGYETTKNIRKLERDQENTSSTPVIALTANAMSTDKNKCKQAGMDDFVSKPFSIHDIESAINRW